MTPEEIRSEEKEFQGDCEFYPPFLVEEFRKGREERRTREKTGKRIPYNPTKITDFLPLITNIWVISNKDYQVQYWGKQGQWGDNYMETMEEFLGDVEAVLDTSDYAVEMTLKQSEMLQKLYYMVEDFEDDPNTPDDPGYGVNDAELIKAPKWEKIRQYAKLVYEELSGDDLDAWEKSRALAKS
uniref:Uncharacterized protein n=1 Tax=Candidatus Kentrum sp. SD TaxID=2126332 RepID=A0A450YU82_9GAMM|nr:MAG: hypothetical protein BECKSD772F_GA0070984_12094 [Candidatus Kentron sp. SD]VFK49686.1 MAG: hypothetical protein BECKSD772E_GA0070983_12144 [Candidatus Kentron sp. SD]VFK81177.1 MAG: hypothetical protein BECKSD772D_GA0070982_12451 [Candidatus Kentron sp. SD]